MTIIGLADEVSLAGEPLLTLTLAGGEQGARPLGLAVDSFDRVGIDAIRVAGECTPSPIGYGVAVDAGFVGKLP